MGMEAQMVKCTGHSVNQSTCDMREITARPTIMRPFHSAAGSEFVFFLKEEVAVHSMSLKEWVVLEEPAKRIWLEECSPNWIRPSSHLPSLFGAMHHSNSFSSWFTPHHKYNPISCAIFKNNLNAPPILIRRSAPEHSSSRYLFLTYPTLLSSPPDSLADYSLFFLWLNPTIS